MSKVTVAPLTTTIKGLSSEVLLYPANGLEQRCAAAFDYSGTSPTERLGRIVGHLSGEQEIDLARAMVLAFDLDVTLLDCPRSGTEQTFPTGRSARRCRSRRVDGAFGYVRCH